MPIISMFYGIVVRMFFYDNKKHSIPHIHIEYQGDKAVLQIPDGLILEGSIPNKKLKLIVAWIELHQDELLADWSLAVNGEEIFKIEGLK